MAEEKKIVHNCGKCGKALKKHKWYYRDQRYYCNKSCWQGAKEKIAKEKEAKAKEAAEAKAKEAEAKEKEAEAKAKEVEAKTKEAEAKTKEDEIKAGEPKDAETPKTEEPGKEEAK